ncbi:MAG: cob(I)yrinic acid a,c-diamide adenosyltransferase [Candidatus Firestonebacteria bacterium]
MKKGLVQVYTGEGKGKTTAVFGLALRAAGHGFKVAIFQFLKAKGNKTGELVLAKKFKNVEIFRNNQTHPMFNKNISPEGLKKNAKLLYEAAERVIKKGKHDLVILDEVNNCVFGGLISEKEVLRIIKNKAKTTELILTGRHASRRILEKADLITEMKSIKHPYEKGIGARKGIEY